MCVFIIEYRINGIAQREKIQQDEEISSYIKYEPDTVDSCISYDTKKERTCNKGKKFKWLSLYEKWRNVVKISGKEVKQEYLRSVRKLHRWIWMRNMIAHGHDKKYWVSESHRKRFLTAMRISPKQYLSWQMLWVTVVDRRMRRAARKCL